MIANHNARVQISSQALYKEINIKINNNFGFIYYKFRYIMALPQLVKVFQVIGSRHRRKANPPPNLIYCFKVRLKANKM
jgi:hypothetical protein